VLRSLALPATYFLAHISDTPAPAIFDQCVIDVGAVGEGHVSYGVPVLVVAVGLERNVFPKGEGKGGVLGMLTISLAFSGQSMPLRRMRSGCVLCRTSIDA
jgi:hypothetical protein